MIIIAFVPLRLTEKVDRNAEIRVARGDDCIYAFIVLKSNTLVAGHIGIKGEFLSHSRRKQVGQSKMERISNLKLPVHTTIQKQEERAMGNATIEERSIFSLLIAPTQAIIACTG